MPGNLAQVRAAGDMAQVRFWLAALAVLVFLLWLFSAVLPPFVVALVLGYLLDPVVGWAHRFGLGRAAAATIILLGALVVVALAAALLAPMLGHQFSNFIKDLPDLVNRAQALIASAGDQMTHGYAGSLLQKFGLDEPTAPDIKGHVADIANKGVQWLGGFANGLLSRGAAVVDVLSWLVIIPVVVFYLLLDWPKMIAAIDGLVPPRHRATIWGLAREIDRALSGFLRGQSLVCLFLALWYGLGLTVVGVNFGLLIGLTGGLLSFIPYIGSLLVLIVSLLIAVVQGWPSWHLPVTSLGVVLVGQFLEGNVLSPKLVGDKVGLHPVWLIFALLAFGSVFGFTVLIVAVPVAATAGVLLRFAVRRYRESPLYAGDEPYAGEELAVPATQTDGRNVA